MNNGTIKGINVKIRAENIESTNIQLKATEISSLPNIDIETNG